MAEVLVGNVLNSKMKTLVNTVNCVGIMGKGIALQFKEKYPEMFKDYSKRCYKHQVKPGVPYLYTDFIGTSVINFPTKDHWRSPSHIEDIKRGLDIFVEKYKEWGIQSVAFPPLGCGNGGQLWSIIGRMMYQKLSKVDIPVEIYAPYGTPPNELKIGFLTQKVLLEDYNHINPLNAKLSSDKIAILEIIYELENLSHVTPIGRVNFQKICYIGTEVGIDTKLNFHKGYYGPFSPDDVKELFHLFANTNLIVEKPHGTMIEIRTGPKYLDIRNKYQMQLNQLKPKISKVVDLFSRIKSTSQAEEVTTVYYAYKQLKEHRNNEIISEQELYDYILSWKKKWNNSDKRKNLSSTIRNLTTLKWINVTFDDAFTIDEFI